MQLDYLCLREILEHVEANSDGFTDDELTFELNDAAETKKAYHYKILVEEKFLDATVNTYGDFQVDNGDGITFIGEVGTVGVVVRLKGLSFSGHKLLEAMRNDTLWSKIKSNAGTVGVEGLKQIPAIALELIKGGVA